MTSLLFSSLTGTFGTKAHETLLEHVYLYPVIDFLMYSKAGGSSSSACENFFILSEKTLESAKKKRMLQKSCVYRAICIGGCAEEGGSLDGIIQWLGFNLRVVKKAWGEED